MKISKKTIEILKNFSNINQSIFFSWGNIIATKDGGDGIRSEEGGRILATATVEEDFPEIGIHNLKQFINLLSLFDDPDIDFYDDKNYFTIHEGKKKIKYGILFDSDNIAHPKHHTVEVGDEHVSFLLSKDILRTIKKVNSEIKVDENMILKIFTSEEGLAISVGHSDVKDNEFELFLNSTQYTYSEFVIYMDVIKYIADDDYKVSVNKMGNMYVLRFESESIVYVCALKTFKV